MVKVSLCVKTNGGKKAYRPNYVGNKNGCRTDVLTFFVVSAVSDLGPSLVALDFNDLPQVMKCGLTFNGVGLFKITVSWNY